MAKVYNLDRSIAEALFAAWVDDDLAYSERVAKKLKEQAKGQRVELLDKRNVLQTKVIECWLSVMKATRKAYPDKTLPEYRKIHPLLPDIMNADVLSFTGGNVLTCVIQKLITNYEENKKRAII